MFLGAVIIVGIAAGGRPLADAYAEKIKFNYRQLGSKAEHVLSMKVNVLQQEIADLKEKITLLENAIELQKKEK